jgi:hypothetical protein
VTRSKLDDQPTRWICGAPRDRPPSRADEPAPDTGAGSFSVRQSVTMSADLADRDISDHRSGNSVVRAWARVRPRRPARGRRGRRCRPRLARDGRGLREHPPGLGHRATRRPRTRPPPDPKGPGDPGPLRCHRRGGRRGRPGVPPGGHRGGRRRRGAPAGCLGLDRGLGGRPPAGAHRRHCRDAHGRRASSARRRPATPTRGGRRCGPQRGRRGRDDDHDLRPRLLLDHGARKAAAYATAFCPWTGAGARRLERCRAPARWLGEGQLVLMGRWPSPPALPTGCWAAVSHPAGATRPDGADPHRPALGATGAARRGRTAAGPAGAGLIVYLVIQFVEGNLLVPIVMRGSVGISPFVVLVSCSSVARSAASSGADGVPSQPS